MLPPPLEGCVAVILLVLVDLSTIFFVNLCLCLISFAFLFLFAEAEMNGTIL